MMKACTKCRKELDESEYYKREGGRLRSACKRCSNKSARLWTENNREKHYAINKEYNEKHKERIKLVAKKRMKNPAARAAAQVACKKWQNKNREKLRCHQRVNDALRYGRLEKGACSVCGGKNVHGHHEDYDKPLEVVWLCPKHHKRAHSKKGHVGQIIEEIGIERD